MKWLATMLLVLSCQGAPGPIGNKGRDGLDGAPGAKGDKGDPGEAASKVEAVPLCPQIVGDWPEYALRIGDELFAVYSSGSKIHLAKLVPGTYITTDGRNCIFTVTPEMEIAYDL